MTRSPVSLTRRNLLRSSSAAALAALALPTTASFAQSAARGTGQQQGPVANRAPLAPQPYYLLPLGAIRPAGWLRRQLEIQADGMGGHLDETWPDVGPNSGWLGGDGESWERGPYFLDGLLPLAWMLDSTELKAKAQRFIDWTLDHPWPNGMIGPRGNDDWWPRMVMLKALTQYHELTGDPRVIPLMTDYFAHQLESLPDRPLKDWGRFRWQDEMLSVIWLYNRTGDERLLKLANLLKQQGWDWQAEFADFPFKAKVTPAQIDLDRKDGDYGIRDKALSAHGVNNAMGIKTMPVWSLVSGSAQDRDAVHHQLAVLDEYHGLPVGIFSADEHFAGRSPSQGVELCAVVETLFSLEHALAITGDARLADRIERIGYNALPGTFTDDMWAHQYDQQPNQIECSHKPGPWTTNGPEANLYGLEPHFGCCTANFHQGWPKLAASLWMGSADGGLAAMVYAPCEVNTVVRSVPVALSQTTDYPFRDTVAISVTPDRPVSFPLKLRIPGWSRKAVIRVNGKPVPTRTKDGFAVIEREWKRGDKVALSFENETRAVTGYNQTVSVEHGPLLFSLPVGERWEKLRDRGLTADWAVYASTPWNYGLEPGATLRRTERPLSPTPFSRRSPPVAVTVAARPVPQWKSTSNYADPPPQGPVKVPDVAPEVLTLIPYGAAKLRITSFPTVAV